VEIILALAAKAGWLKLQNPQKEEKIALTHTGLLMEGRYNSGRRSEKYSSFR